MVVFHSLSGLGAGGEGKEMADGHPLPILAGAFIGLLGGIVYLMRNCRNGIYHKNHGAGSHLFAYLDYERYAKEVLFYRIKSCWMQEQGRGDQGATHQGRNEKDDTLRLVLANRTDYGE